MTGSKINPKLTIDYLTTVRENKYFDRKSAKIASKDLPPLITAFANAEGGTVVIGISDNMQIEGINSVGEDKINDFLNAPSLCRPMPDYEYEYLDVTNCNGIQDRLLLIHVKCSSDQIIRTSNDKTYLRIGDKTKEMLGDTLRNLEYAKGTRHFEDECNEDASIEDLDVQLIQKYKEAIGASNLDTWQVLKARGFIRKKNGREYLTNAAVLLFADNIQSFYSNCRVRFVRYDGSQSKVGTEINIVKDHNIEGAIPNIIEEARRFISGQLREFTSLDIETGRFQNIPEYPEFAWLEGIVNAVTHREYAMDGRYILVRMYDDRLEIESPGGLPNIVTVDNILFTRYSRNPKISRVLTDLGWVRELNEGVKRIFSDMKKNFLDKPVYSNRENTVTLTLHNNIIMRSLRQNQFAISCLGEENWTNLDDVEKQILTFIINKGAANSSQLAAYTGKSIGTIHNRLKRLIECKFIKPNGNKSSPNRTYEAMVK